MFEPKKKGELFCEKRKFEKKSENQIRIERTTEATSMNFFNESPVKEKI